MAKAARLERLDIRRAELEAEYRDALISALRETAAGKWGLFDHNQDRAARATVAPVLDNLNEIAEVVDKMRLQLGLDPFPLHQLFLASRGRVSSHAVGEPRQAKAWLDRLETGEV
ncbi:MAG: hypothetical protein CVT77_12270 [Alphaproteobacteria bacterium HGW-Alphaproteobacteria-16]|nr:MAG: hypothetical protein CVT77_12270 [Alphaproteobacteria bacterium HGW-Alphaproteobacteria-16]